jgi:hypothetical protein
MTRAPKTRRTIHLYAMPPVLSNAQVKRRVQARNNTVRFSKDCLRLVTSTINESIRLRLDKLVMKILKISQATKRRTFTVMDLEILKQME